MNVERKEYKRFYNFKKNQNFIKFRIAKNFFEPAINHTNFFIIKRNFLIFENKNNKN